MRRIGAPKLSGLRTLRIRIRLARVSRELRTRQAEHLNSRHRVLRRVLLDSLDQYRLSRRFPRNTYKSERVPVFVDKTGRLCAVAHLITASGHRALVERISQTQNLARVQEMHDSELASWASDHGLKIDELAQIQPTYGPEHGATVDPFVAKSILIVGGAAIAGVFATVASLVARVEHRHAARIVMAIAGVLTFLETILVFRGDLLVASSADFLVERPPIAIPMLIVTWLALATSLVLWRLRRRRT